MNNHASSSSGWATIPRNGNIPAYDGTYSNESPRRMTTFFSSSANSSPCSFISAISTIEDDLGSKVLDEHELVSCSLTTSRTAFASDRSRASAVDGSSKSVSWLRHTNITHSHTLDEQGWRQNQNQELVRDADKLQLGSSEHSKDDGLSPYQPVQNHIRESHVCKCDPDHDPSQPEQPQNIAPILPTPLPVVTSCFRCLSVPSTSLVLAPASTHAYASDPTSTPIASSLSSSCMCSVTTLPYRRYRTISSAVASLGLASALSSMSATIGESEGSGEASSAIVPSLALAHPVPVDDCGDNADIGGSSNPVLQSSASLPELVSEPETPVQKQVIGAAVSSATSLLSFPKDPCCQTPEFDSLYQHQAPRQRTPQQPHRFQRVANLEDTPPPLSINIKTHDEAINASSMAQNPYIQHNNTNRYTATNMIPTPESPESSSPSNSSPAFHSPSTSITWGPPSTTNRGSLIAISHFASLSERSSQSQSKGKGVMRTYRYSRRRTGRACFDGLPREIKIHVFRYLSTFQLVRISRVSRSWRGLAMDGSLWKAIDVTRYYKTIQDNQLRILGTAASGFLRYANFRGCSQLSGHSLSVIAEHCPNIERLNLTGCRAITSKSIVDVCMNMPLLVHLDLAGLQSVNNNTLQTMAVYCRTIKVLNLAWCKQISGSGLIKLARSCQELRKLNISGCTNLEDRLMPVMGVNLPKLRELCLNGCNSLTDRGLIGLLSGLSLGSSKKHRKWRMRKRMSSSVRVSSLGHLLINQSSSNGDDDEEYSEEEQDKEDSVKEEESDRESDASDEDADGEDGNEATNSSPMQHSSTVANTPNQITQDDQDGRQTRLVYLGLSQCRLLTHEALRAIGHLCSQHLRRLELSNCENIGDEGLIQLAQRCSRLRLLDLEDVGNLTDVSLRAFAMYLPKLERICLSYCENITDQGVTRMLRPASNPTTLSTATAMMINAETASLYCRKLVHLELDNCPLITDQLLLEFANVLEERAVASMERQKERERKREERRERIRQKKRAMSPQKESGYGLEDKGEEHNPRASSDQTGVEHGQDMLTTESSNMASVAGASFASSRPVNIPNRFRHIPAIAGSSLTSYSSSPLQPRSVLASTLLSDEVVIKKTRPGTRIMVPARSASTSSTTSCTSLPLWNSGASSRRNNSSVTIVNGGRRANGVVVNKPIRPTIQVFDCRSITLEGVEAARTRCSSLTIRSYYSWTHPETSAPTTSAAFGGSSAIEGVDGDEGDEDTDTEHNMNTSQTSLHHLQLQQQHLQQYLQHRSRASDLLRRARLGLIGRTGGTQDAQCTIL